MTSTNELMVESGQFMYPNFKLRIVQVGVQFVIDCCFDSHSVINACCGW